MNPSSIPAETFAARRARFQAALGEGVAVVPGLPAATASVAGRFRQDPDLRYLTGWLEPDSCAVFTATRFVLFVPPRDRAVEVWNGRRAGVAGALERFGADEAYASDELDAKLVELFENAPRVWYRHGKSRRMDERVQKALDGVRAKERRGSSTPHEFADPHRLVHEARRIKSDEELYLMRRAAEISRDGHRAAAQLCRAGRFEYELEAELYRVFRGRGGDGCAYPSIVGTGENATILHYVENASALQTGELVLIDAGVEYEGYASDVTRTYPVGGRFEGAARDVYAAVLRAQELAIAASRAEATLPEVHAVALRALVEGCVALGALDGDVDGLIESEAYRPFYMHSTSHFLGMDVHDVGAYFTDGKPRALEPGICFTVEPGLYFSAEDEACPDALRGIGVRIEDDVVITRDGIEVLTDFIPKRIDDVEAWMRE